MKEKLVKKRQHGGAWKAFIGMMSKSSAGRPDLMLLAKLYMAEAASVSDIYNMAVEQGKLQVAVDKVWAAAGNKGKLMMVTKRNLLRWNIFRTSTAIDGVIDELTALTKAKQSASKQEHEAEQKLVEEYEKRFGATEKVKLKQKIPVLADTQVSVVPQLDAMGFELHLQDLQERAVRVSSWLATHKQTNLGSALDVIWQSIHETVQPDSASTEERYLRVLKETFKSKELRSLLSHGFVVLEFIEVHAEDPGTANATASPKQFFWHVAQISWNPYVTTLHSVSPVLRPNNSLLSLDYPWLGVSATYGVSVRQEPDRPDKDEPPNEGRHGSKQALVVRAPPVLSGVRLAAEASCEVPGLGYIRYYLSKEAFECHCPCGHNKCVLARTSRGHLKKNQTGCGRPLGMMIAWPQMGIWERELLDLNTGAEIDGRGS
eukprot:5253369-Amphidinium_carterae.4